MKIGGDRGGGGGARVNRSYTRRVSVSFSWECLEFPGMLFEAMGMTVCMAQAKYAAKHQWFSINSGVVMVF